MKTNRTNTAGRLLALLLLALMMLSLTACGTKNGDKADGMSSEPKNAEEAVAMHKELMAQENAILSEDTALWEKVFMAADKGMTMQENGKNYGEFLLDTIEGSKDQFTEDELKLLKEAAEKIREIENKLTMIEKKYPEAAQQSTDGNETAISEAKDVLSKKGATYRNVYFPSGGEAGRFTTNVFAYPTTYVVDRDGNIVGDPIVGAITGKAQTEALQAQIDKVLSADMGCARDLFIPLERRTTPCIGEYCRFF